MTQSHGTSPASRNWVSASMVFWSARRAPVACFGTIPAACPRGAPGMDTQQGDAVAVLPALGDFDDVGKSVGESVRWRLPGTYPCGAGVNCSN